MEENNNDNKKNVVYEVKKEENSNNTNFKTVQNPSSYKIMKILKNKNQEVGLLKVFYYHFLVE